MRNYAFHNLIDYVYYDDNAPLGIRGFVELTEKIDPAILRSAIDYGMKRYPYYCVEIKINGNRYEYFPNNRTIPLIQGKDPIRLCGKEANYHQLVFRYDDNRIYADFNHCLFDGYSCTHVFTTVLYYYCKEFYDSALVPTNIHCYEDGMTIPDEEWENPLEKVEGPRVPFYQHSLMPQTAFSLNGTFQADGKTTAYRLEIDEKMFMNYCANSDGSPNAAIHVFVSRAISKLNPDTDAIRSSVCVHMGKYLHANMSYAGLTTVVMIPFLDRMKKQPLNMQISLTKSMINLNCDDDNMQKIIQSYAARARYWSEGKTLAECMNRCKSEPYNPLDFPTFVVSYCREAGLETLSKYIKDFSVASYLFVPLLVNISCFKGKFLIDFLQGFSDRKYFDAFLRELDDAKIEYTIKSTENGAVSKLDFPRIS